MTTDTNLAKKKVVVLAASVCMFSFLLSMLPLAAIRHGIPAVWVVLPVCTLAMVGMALLKVFFDLQALGKAGGNDGWQ